MLSIQCEERIIATAELSPGFHGEHVDFERNLHEDSASYAALAADIAANGIRNPLITHRGHVLIGMRRWEIATRLGIPSVRCLDITEDVSKWGRDDIYVRLQALRDQLR